jgi:hypothetical protein
LFLSLFLNLVFSIAAGLDLRGLQKGIDYKFRLYDYKFQLYDYKFQLLRLQISAITTTNSGCYPQAGSAFCSLRSCSEWPNAATVFGDGG